MKINELSCAITLKEEEGIEGNDGILQEQSCVTIVISQ